MPASLRSETVCLRPGMLFAFPSESAFAFAGILNAVRLVACCRNAESGADPVRHVSYESETARGKQNHALAAIQSLPIPMCQENFAQTFTTLSIRPLHPTICDCQLVKLDVTVRRSWNQ